MKNHNRRFVLCIRNGGAEDLEPRKVYQVLPDRAAMADDYVRVVDESGEDYLYPLAYFVPVRLPAAASRELLSQRPATVTRRRTGGLRVRTARRTARLR